jgi:hypothetical protein
MQFLVAQLIGALAVAAASLVGRVLLALFFSYVTYKGFDTGITFVLNQIKNSMSGVPTTVASFIAWCWVDKGVSMIVSAVLASVAIRGITNGSITKMVLKK